MDQFGKPPVQGSRPLYFIAGGGTGVFTFLIVVLHAFEIYVVERHFPVQIFLHGVLIHDSAVIQGTLIKIDRLSAFDALDLFLVNICDQFSKSLDITGPDLTGLLLGLIPFEKEGFVFVIVRVCASDQFHGGTSVRLSGFL